MSQQDTSEEDMLLLWAGQQPPAGGPRKRVGSGAKVGHLHGPRPVALINHSETLLEELGVGAAAAQAAVTGGQRVQGRCRQVGCLQVCPWREEQLRHLRGDVQAQDVGLIGDLALHLQTGR